MSGSQSFLGVQDSEKKNKDVVLLGAVSSGLSMADIVISRPQPLPEVDLPLRESRFNEGEMFFLFSKVEIKQSAELFCFSVALKFLRRDLLWIILEVSLRIDGVFNRYLWWGNLEIQGIFCFVCQMRRILLK